MKNLTLENIENHFKDKKTQFGISFDALDYLKRVGFPDTKNEDWKYTDVKDILTTLYEWNPQTILDKRDFNEIQLKADERAYYAVLVNGNFIDSLSKLPNLDEFLKIKPISKVNLNEIPYFEKYIGKIANYKLDSFTALNTIFIHDGLFIYLGKNQILEKPLYIYCIDDGRYQNSFSQVRNTLVFEKNAKACIIEVYVSLGEQITFSNHVTEIYMDVSTCIEYVKIQNLNNNGNAVTKTHVYQKKHSASALLTFSLGGNMVRNNLQVILDDENCETNMHGLVIANGYSHIDNHTVVEHQKPYSTSNELYKNILGDHATGVFNGKILVAQNAQKTLAYQSNQNILLSNNSSINSKPQLEIFANDVKCSHGATSGQLNEQALFYLRSRGIDEKTAKIILTQAFAEDIVEKVKVPELREELKVVILNKLNDMI
jgi:Fe-S cluster assembly protein SufD